MKKYFLAVLFLLVTVNAFAEPEHHHRRHHRHHRHHHEVAVIVH